MAINPDSLHLLRSDWLLTQSISSLGSSISSGQGGSLGSNWERARSFERQKQKLVSYPVAFPELVLPRSCQGILGSGLASPRGLGWAPGSLGRSHLFCSSWYPLCWCSLLSPCACCGWLVLWAHGAGNRFPGQGFQGFVKWKWLGHFQDTWKRKASCSPQGFKRNGC